MYNKLLSMATAYLKASLRNSFNLTEFKNMEPEKAYYYADETLPIISSGSSRVAYILSSTKVLKLALNVKGIAQNETEYIMFQKYKSTNLITKVYETDNDSHWMISELVRPATNSDFDNILGVSFDDFTELISLTCYDEEIYDHLDEKSKQFIKNVYDLKTDANLVDADQLTSWGKTVDGMLVLLDTGADREIIQQYYQFDRGFNTYEPFYKTINSSEAFNKLKSMIESDYVTDDAEVAYLSHSLIKNKNLAEAFLELKNNRHYDNQSFDRIVSIFAENDDWNTLLFGQDYDADDYDNA